MGNILKQKVSGYILTALMGFGLMVSSCSQNKPFDSYGGVTSIKGEKTGWFHVEKLNDRWFFVTPGGNAFFSLGATHAVECIPKDELNLFETRYNSNEEELSRVFLDYFKKWGYNSSGYGPLPSMEKEIPYVVEVWTNGPKSLSAGDNSQWEDIFDLSVQDKVEKRIKEITERHVNNPNCLGYVGIDLPLWVVEPKNVVSYIDFIRGLKSSNNGKNEYAGFLWNKYSDRLDDFETIYGFKPKSFFNILKTDLSVISQNKNEEVLKDDEAFLAIMADTYFKFLSKTFKAYDPNHLYLGDRFMAIPDDRPHMKVPDAILQVAAKYVDVISFQPMGTLKTIDDYLNHVHNITNKPVLLADVNCHTTRLKEGQTNTEEYERTTGELTYSYYEKALNCKALIGIHRCTVRDYRSWDTNFHRRGILKADETPYPILEEYTIKSSRMVYDKVYND